MLATLQLAYLFSSFLLASMSYVGAGWHEWIERPKIHRSRNSEIFIEWMGEIWCIVNDLENMFNSLRGLVLRSRDCELCAVGEIEVNVNRARYIIYARIYCVFFTLYNILTHSHEWAQDIDRREKTLTPEKRFLINIFTGMSTHSLLSACVYIPPKRQCCDQDQISTCCSQVEQYFLFCCII